MPEFRVITPQGKIVATKNFDNAEAAYAWFIRSVGANSELGWRMEVNDEGEWAFFDDTGGFTAPGSSHRYAVKHPAQGRVSGAVSRGPCR
ncbi:hypothetical protein H7I94_16135 [Mycobacterium szulgai]|nr:hypothetical protein [Mycobacterium szulgai]